MVRRKRIPIPEETRVRLLRWCARHCCFCGRACTVNIEIDHIDEDPSNNEPENLVPLCFDCHGQLHHYNPRHPRGISYRAAELRARRNEVYEENTRQYLRHVEVQLTNTIPQMAQPGKPLPRREPGAVTCIVQNTATDLPVQLRLRLRVFQNEHEIEAERGPLYSGQRLWNLNPSVVIIGWFRFPADPARSPFHYRVDGFWQIIDVVERPHEMLPFSFVWNDPAGDWWSDPEDPRGRGSL